MAFFKGELLAHCENPHNTSVFKWFSFLACRAEVPSHSAFPFYSTYHEISLNGWTTLLFPFHLSCRQYNGTSHFSPYHRVFAQATLQSKWTIRWHMSVDQNGLANHLVLKWLASRYSLIRKNLLLIVQTSDDLGSWLSRWGSICHKGTANGLFSKGSCLLPLKTRISRQSSSDLASWRVVRESQVTVHSHSTAPIRRSPRMAQLLSCTQFKDLGLMCRDKIKGLRYRIMPKRLRYYINNCLLSNQKGRAIKALTRTNKGQNQLAFRSVLRPSNVLFFRSVFFLLQFYSRAYTPLKTMPARAVLITI